MANSTGELLDLTTSTINSIKEDWLKYPYIDKFVSYHNKYQGQSAKFIDYNYENGEKIRFIVLEPDLSKNEYIFEIKIYKVNRGVKSKKKKLYDLVKDLLIDITNKSSKRPIKKENPKNKERLITINKSILLKQAQLDSMLGNEPNYFSLVNELNAYKKMAEKLSA